MSPSAATVVANAGKWPGNPAGEREMRSAERVRASSRPRVRPRLDTLDVAGGCLPGSALGGDLYDFLYPSPGKLVLVLGDVSGHGIPAALMMATLQATLRTHYALTTADLGERVESVNRLFFDSTAAEHYAALFVGEYDDRTGRLRYANCGHVPPLLLRADGDLVRLRSTGTLLGMFESWGGSLDEVTLAAGDTLVLVTDGVTEAADRGQGEFGELRLLSEVMRYRHLEPAALVRAIGRSVRLACGRKPVDDATVVVARVRAPNVHTDGGE